MFAALGVLRIVLVLNTLAWSIYRDSFERNGLGWTLVAVMGVWTLVSIGVYAAPDRRNVATVGLDVALALAMLLLTPAVKGDDFGATVPGFWINGALLACAIRFGWVGGAVAGVLLGGADLYLRVEATQQDYGNVFLILLAGTAVGFLCSSLQRMAAERDRAQAAAAAAAERARLARVVHDGVLQTLALVQRHGRELGEQGAELGRLAGQQEVRLRALIRSQDAVPETAGGAAGPEVADLASAIGALSADRHVEAALPGAPVLMPRDRADELVAVVGACLDNVARHAGPEASAWVLLEDLGERVVLSVRDDGPGIPPGRLEAAAAEGRLGVSGSIRGRVADLGGTATLTSGPSGTEWEFEVPRETP